MSLGFGFVCRGRVPLRGAHLLCIHSILVYVVFLVCGASGLQLQYPTMAQLFDILFPVPFDFYGVIFGHHGIWPASYPWLGV